MHFTSENHIDDVVERNFILGGIRGILGRPALQERSARFRLSWLASQVGPWA